jgi:hypothetical protein
VPVPLAGLPYVHCLNRDIETGNVPTMLLIASSRFFMVVSWERSGGRPVKKLLDNFSCLHAHIITSTGDGGIGKGSRA